MLGVESESLKLKLSDPERKKRAPRKTARLTDGKTGKETLSHDLGPEIGEVSGNGTPAISGQMQVGEIYGFTRFGCKKMKDGTVFALFERFFTFVAFF